VSGVQGSAASFSESAPFQVRGCGGGGGDGVLALGSPPFLAGKAGHGLEAVGSRIVTRGDVKVVRHSDLLILLHSDPGLLHATPTRGTLSILINFVNIYRNFNQSRVSE